MEIVELYHPEITARAGSYLLTQGIEVEVYSSQDSYFDWAKIRFTEQYQPKITITKKEPANISIGYNGNLESVFEGFVSMEYNGGGFENEINLKDEMLLLEETIVNDTFLNTTPQEMIAFFLSKAGISKMALSSQGYPERKKVSIRKMNIIQAINAVHAAWGIKNKFFFSGGVFYWGEKPKQSKVFIFEYGKNILDLIRVGSLWGLETVSAPWIKHSQKIKVIHPTISGEHEVKKVVTRTNDLGFIRTSIYF